MRTRDELECGQASGSVRLFRYLRERSAGPDAWQDGFWGCSCACDEAGEAACHELSEQSSAVEHADEG